MLHIVFLICVIAGISLTKPVRINYISPIQQNTWVKAIQPKCLLRKERKKQTNNIPQNAEINGFTEIFKALNLFIKKLML